MSAPAINPPARRKKSAASSTTRSWSDRRGWAGSHANANIRAVVIAKSVTTLSAAR